MSKQHDPWQRLAVQVQDERNATADALSGIVTTLQEMIALLRQPVRVVSRCDAKQDAAVAALRDFMETGRLDALRGAAERILEEVDRE